jgi:hypothetical protein
MTSSFEKVLKPAESHFYPLPFAYFVARPYQKRYFLANSQLFLNYANYLLTLPPNLEI